MDLMTLFAAIQLSGDSIINSLLFLVVMGIVFFVLFWLLGKTPIPEPFKTVVTWVLYLFAAVVVINFLLTLIGHPIVKW